jgi:signal transduction histidine kinase
VISDEGIGIPESQLPQLFQPFVRLESKLKLQNPGTGLGLYLTRKLVEEVLGGEVSVQSRAGEGSVFTMRLPLRMSTDQDDVKGGIS